jgi:hypothetical protein
MDIYKNQVEIETFSKAINEKNIKVFKELLNESKNILPVTFKEVINKSLGDKDYTFLELLLNHKNFNPSQHDNKIITFSSFIGHHIAVEMILKDSRTNPSTFNNFAIQKAALFKFWKTVYLLWDHPSVKNSLKNDSLYLYNILTERDIKSKVKDF